MPKKRKTPPHKVESSDKTALRHELIVQDLIAGLPVAELVLKYSVHRNTISNIKQQHLERITQERELFLLDRQEGINKAIEDDVDTLAQVVKVSGQLMMTAMEKLSKSLNADKVDPRSLGMAIEAFQVVRKLVLNQQKEATKPL